jgi:hypothetical protein
MIHVVVINASILLFTDSFSLIPTIRFFFESSLMHSSASVAMRSQVYRGTFLLLVS